MLLNIFYMLFKSNAKETKEGIDQLDKATKGLGQDFDKANEKATELGRNFVKLVETGAALAGGYAGFNFFKAGVIQATEYNKQLYVTSTLTKEHAGQLKALAQLSAQFGGDRQGALHNLSEMARFSQSRLGREYDPMKHLMQLRQQYKMLGNNPQAQAALLYGPGAPFTEQGLQMAITASDAEFKKQTATAGFKGAMSLTDDQAKNAFDLMSTKEDLKGSVDQLNTTISDTLSHTLQNLIEALSNLTHKLGSTALGAFAGAGIGIAGAALFGGLKWGAAAKMLLGQGAKKAATTAAVDLGFSMTGAAVGGGAGVAAGAGLGTVAAVGGGALAVGTAAGYGIVSLFSKQIEALMVKYLTRDLKTTTPRTVSGAMASPVSDGGDLAFWMNKGYSHDQAAGIVANMTRESNGNPTARGDGGKAHGLFQWHPGRRKAILDATGIDVSNASRQQQMEAAAWEMKNGDVGFNDDYFRKLKGANVAAGYFSGNFERPANGMNEAIKRGQMALGIASQTKMAPASVSIGDIHISAPGGNADDIARKIRTAIIGACSDVQSKADNGRLG